MGQAASGTVLRVGDVFSCNVHIHQRVLLQCARSLHQHARVWVQPHPANITKYSSVRAVRAVRAVNIH